MRGSRQDWLASVCLITLDLRAELEISYAKGLHKMANKLKRALEKMKKNGMYDAFACVSEEICSTGDLHQKLGLAIQQEAIKPTLHILQEHDKKKKSLDSEVEKTTRPVINNWKKQIKIKKRLMDHTKKHESLFHTVQNNRKPAGEKEAQKLLEKLKKSAESLTEKDENYYKENIEGLAARLKWETSLEDWYQSIQDLEKERIQLLCNILNRYNEHVSKFGETLAMCQQQIDNAISKVDVERDIKNFMEETTISSEENKSEYLLTDYYEEDLTNAIEQERRKQSLNMKLQRLQNDIEKASRDKDGLARMLQAGRENPAFSDAKTQEDTALLLDETKLKLCLLESNFFKISSVLAELEKKPRPSHPSIQCIFTWEEKGYRHSAVQISRPIRMKRLQRSVSVASSADSASMVGSLRFGKHSSKRRSLTFTRTSARSVTATGAAAAPTSEINHVEDMSQTDSDSESFSISGGIYDSPELPETRNVHEDIPDASDDSDTISISDGTYDSPEIPETRNVHEDIRDASRDGVLLSFSCRAMYTYQAEREDELSFMQGDSVVVERKNENGWWYGTSNEKKGYFPSTYVEERQDDSSQI
ncbi:nostrin isoform X2 [Lissotriton helveticus]